MREADIGLGDSGFEAMGIAELIELGEAAGVHHLEELECRGTGAIIQCEVESRFDEARLERLECVTRWERVAQTDNGFLYVIELVSPNLPDELAHAASDLLGTCDPTLEDDRVTMSLVGDQEDIAAVISAYESIGIMPELDRLGEYTGRSQPLADLTDRQRHVIETAHEMGFYQVPRGVSTEEIAEELDLDASTVAEHLQRAERNLMAALL